MASNFLLLVIYKVGLVWYKARNMGILWEQNSLRMLTTQ